jgi:hypothetical protein
VGVDCGVWQQEGAWCLSLQNQGVRNKLGCKTEPGLGHDCFFN